MSIPKNTTEDFTAVPPAGSAPAPPPSLPAKTNKSVRYSNPIPPGGLSSAQEPRRVQAMNPEQRDNRVYWPAQLYIFVYYVIPLILEIFVYGGDIITDIIVAGVMLSHGMVLPGIFTLVFMYLPPIIALCGIFYKLCSESKDRNGQEANKSTFKEACIFSVLFFFFPIWPLFKYMLLIPRAWNAFWYREGRQDNLLKINEQTKVDEYRFYQAFLQAAPQFLFQMFLILLESPDRHNYYLVVQQVYCVMFSALSLTLVTVKYQNRPAQKPKLRKVKRTRSSASDGKRLNSTSSAGSNKPKMTNDAEAATERDPALMSPGDVIEVIEEDIIEITADSDNMATVLMSFFGWLFLIGGRVFALALFASKFHWAFFILVAVHVTAFTLYYSYKNKINCCREPTKTIAVVFAGFVLLFCVANYHVHFTEELGIKPTIFLTIYFGVTLLENIGVVVGWYVATTSQLWYHDVGLGLSLTCYLVGIVMLLLAHWMRVSADEELLDLDGTGREATALNIKEPKELNVDVEDPPRREAY